MSANPQRTGCPPPPCAGRPSNAPPSRPNRRAQQGAIAVMMIVIVLALFAMLSLSVDAGYWLLTRERAQTAADAAALAGAHALARGASKAEIERESRALATANGFDNGRDGITVPVDPGQDQVAVTISAPASRFFSALTDIADFDISATAVAQVETTAGLSLGITALGPSEGPPNYSIEAHRATADIHCPLLSYADPPKKGGGRVMHVTASNIKAEDIQLAGTYTARTSAFTYCPGTSCPKAYHLNPSNGSALRSELDRIVGDPSDPLHGEIAYHSGDLTISNQSEMDAALQNRSALYVDGRLSFVNGSVRGDGIAIVANQITIQRIALALYDCTVDLAAAGGSGTVALTQ